MKLAWLDPEASWAPCAISDLAAAGVHHEHLAAGTALAQSAIDRLKAQRGYVSQDIVELSQATPDLPQICAKFSDEHLHTDDEVRYVLDGEGIFDIRSADDRWMRVTVEKGDLIVVPADRYHRFFLTDLQHIRCVRLFQDATGWVPHYREHV